MKIVSLQIAKLAGLRYYFTGRPCKHGHVDKRYANNNVCLRCARERWQFRDPDDRKRYNARQRVLWRKLREDPTYRERDNARKRKRREDPDCYERDSARARKRKGLSEPAHPETMHCEICGVLAESLSKRLCFDHDHETGKFRGWLCDKCNRGLGILGDTLPALRRVIAYLERTQ